MFFYIRICFHRYNNSILLGQNILGYSPVTTRGGIQYFSGIFGEELVAGGYVLMFSIIGFFQYHFYLKVIKKFHYQSSF